MGDGPSRSVAPAVFLALAAGGAGPYGQPAAADVMYDVENHGSALLFGWFTQDMNFFTNKVQRSPTSSFGTCPWISAIF